MGGLGDDKHFLQLISTLAALVTTLLSALTIFYVLEANRLSVQNQVSTQMREYLSAYERVSTSVPGDPFGIEGFVKMTGPEQQRAIIVVGLLIGLVDLMYQADDRRVDLWSTYIEQFHGPVACYGALVAYAADSRTVRVIRAARTKLRSAPLPCSDK